VLFIPENPSYPILDNALVDEIPAGLTVLRLPIREPYRFAGFLGKNKIANLSAGILPKEGKQSFLEKVALWIRGNIFIPDARVLWVKPSIKFLNKYLQQAEIDTVITTGPPHSMHLIGLGLDKKVKWFADFRDPWTSIGYHKALKLGNFAKRRHLELEKQVLNSASHIIVTSPGTAAEFSGITSRPISVVTNGFDVPIVEPGILEGKFTLAHIGSLLSSRNPTILWRVLSILAKEEAFAKDFELNLVGRTSQGVIDSITALGLERFLTVTPYVSHEDAVALQRNAQVLLLLEVDSPETRSIIPGKLFEYLASGRPIISLGPNGSDIAPILRQTLAGEFFDYQEEDRLLQHIQLLYKAYKDGTLQAATRGAEQYSRRAVSEQLAKILS
jgi:glycosyltransferase involved in cell wall biosynthesis